MRAGRPACACRVQRLVLGALPLMFSMLFVREGLSLNLEIIISENSEPTSCGSPPASLTPH